MSRAFSLPRASSLRALFRELDRFSAIQLAIVLSALLLFLILPLASVIAQAFIYEGRPSLKHFVDLFSDPNAIARKPSFTLIRVETVYRYKVLPNGTRVMIPEKVLYIGRFGPDFGYVLNSIFVASMVALFTTIIGTTVALIMARYSFPGKAFFQVALLVPMLATPFVNSYVIGKVLGQGGLVNYLFHDKLGILPFRVEVSGLPAVILIQTLSFFPIVYLNVLAAMINIDPSMEEQAECLGARGFRLFRTIVLPLSMPGIMAGATTVFILSLEDLGAPIGLSGAFGSGLHEKIISFKIYEAFRAAVGGLSQVPSVVYAMAALLLFISAAAFLLIKKYVSLRMYAMLSKGGRWSPRVRPLGLKGKLLVYPFLTLLLIIAAFPQIGVILLAATDWAMRVGVPLPSRFTLEYLRSLVADPEVFRSIVNSLTYSSCALVLIIIIGTSAAYLVARSHLPGIGLLDLLVTLPIAIPGIIVAVGYLFFFASYFARTPFDPFINPGLLLIFTYTIRRMPFTVRSVFAGLQQTHVSLEEASYSLGASRSTTFFRIVLPLIAANVIGGGLLSFVYSMSEVSTSITLPALNPAQGPITFLMSQKIYGSAAVGAVSVAAALGVLLMTLQIIVITLVNRLLKQRVAFLGV